MTHRIALQPNGKYIPSVNRAVNLCSEHLSPLNDILREVVSWRYGGPGWHIYLEDDVWYLEVDREDDLVYISLML